VRGVLSIFLIRVAERAALRHPRSASMILTFLTSPRRSRAVGCLVVLCTVAGMIGCQTSAKSKAQQSTAAVVQAEALKASLEKASPGTLVGDVLYTLPDRPYTAVGDVDMKGVQVGQIVSFVDADGKPVNNGTVVAIVGDNAHVRFDTAGKRPPRKGDLAVWLKE
jgi:hypothetical protein